MLSYPPITIIPGSAFHKRQRNPFRPEIDDINASPPSRKHNVQCLNRHSRQCVPQRTRQNPRLPLFPRFSLKLFFLLDRNFVPGQQHHHCRDGFDFEEPSSDARSVAYTKGYEGLSRPVGVEEAGGFEVQWVFPISRYMSIITVRASLPVGAD
jgi:hypothetical protein